MIRVEYECEKRTHKLKVEGHAGYSECGNDIVCSAMSAISYALVGFLENTDTRYICEDMECGYLELSCPKGKDADAAFKMALIGYMQVEKQYPRNVEVILPTWG